MTTNLTANPLIGLLNGAPTAEPGAAAAPFVTSLASSESPLSGQTFADYMSFIQSLGLETSDGLHAMPSSADGLPQPLVVVTDKLPDAAEAVGVTAAPGVPEVLSVTLPATADGKALPATGEPLPADPTEPALEAPLDLADPTLAAVGAVAQLEGQVTRQAPGPATATGATNASTPALSSYAAILRADGSVATELVPPAGARADTASPSLAELATNVDPDGGPPADLPRATSADVLRDLWRLQGGRSGTDPARAAMAAPTGLEALADTGGPDVPVSELARPANTVALERPVQAPPVLPLARPVGAPGWEQALGQRIVWAAENGIGQAELRLDPPHLGNLSVRIAMSDDQAQVMFQAQNPAAREALESALPRLREMFAEHGLQLGDADVRGGDGDRAHHEGDEAPAREAGPATPEAELGDASRDAARAVAAAGLIDTYA